MADEVSSELQNRLKEDSSYFNSLVRLIPVKFYLPDDEEEKSNKFYKNRGKKAPKQEIKDASRKAKKKRLDPKLAKNVVDLQEAEEAENDDSDGGDSEGDGNNNTQAFSVEKVPSGKIADLRARLHERIEALQGKRKPTSEKHSKRPKKRMKSEIKTENKKMNDIAQSKKDKSNKESRPWTNSSVKNNQGQVVFSKFDFMERSKNPKHGSKMRNYKNLIAKAEMRQKKIDDLKQTDASKAKELVEKHAWQSALDKAEGQKVKDDPKLLKKSLKRKEKMKARSKKQWDERKEQQKKQMDDKQKRRQKNLKERAEAKKNKGGKGKKHRPGF